MPVSIWRASAPELATGRWGSSGQAGAGAAPAYTATAAAQAVAPCLWRRSAGGAPVTPRRTPAPWHPSQAAGPTVASASVAAQILASPPQSSRSHPIALQTVNRILLSHRFQAALKEAVMSGNWSHHDRGRWLEGMDACHELEESLAMRIRAMTRWSADRLDREERRDLVTAKATLKAVRNGLFILGQHLRCPHGQPLSAEELLAASNPLETGLGDGFGIPKPLAAAMEIYSWSVSVKRHHPNLNGAFLVINTALRTNSRYMKHALGPLIDGIVQALDALPRLREPAGCLRSVHRGLALHSKAAYDNFRDGLMDQMASHGARVLKDPAFVTASTTRPYPGNVQITYELLRDGQDRLDTAARDTSRFNAAGQGEVVFKPGTRFEIVSAREHAAGDPARPVQTNLVPNTTDREVEDFVHMPLLCIACRELPDSGPNGGTPLGIGGA